MLRSASKPRRRAKVQRQSIGPVDAVASTASFLVIIGSFWVFAKGQLEK
jgi:hypothetical protein